MYKTAGIIIIGDEILKGHVAEKNSHFLCQKCFLSGIKVSKISVISDIIDDIYVEVLKFIESYDIVITTGGVGPTHDDVTYEGVAKAFGETLYVNEEMYQYFRLYLSKVPNGDKEDNPLLKMVKVPQSSEIIFLNVPDELQLGKNIYPLVKVHNVFIFPGVPKYVQHLFSDLQKTYFSNGVKVFYNRTIFLNKDENIIASVLYNVVERYKETVTFGSYPECGLNADYETKVTIESSVMEHCLAAESMLLMEFPPSWIVYLENSKPIDYSQFLCFLKSKNSLVLLVENSLKIIEECLTKNDLSNIFVSFNGGKDCTVMLYLIYYVYQRKEMFKLSLLKALYSCYDGTFAEEEEFVHKCAERYKLDLTTIKGSVKESLITFLDNNPNRTVSFLGIRNSDPAGKDVKPFQMTDKDWPKMLRIFPLLEWKYEDIWCFLRSMNIPYCSLYNYGYTSVGTKQNTSPNSALLCKDVYDGRIYYRPAYLLKKYSEEREGRLQ